MFSKKPHADIKKSTQKLQDHKKDSATRFKHLRIILDHVDNEEAKSLFEINFSHVYYVLYDCFINADNNLKQKVHKAHREELEGVLYVLDKIFILLPELLSRRWQCHSITRLLTKTLHPGNSHKLRREAVRLFLIWYQILGENSPDEVHALFATLVPGFFSPFPEYPGLSVLNQASSATVFHDAHHGPVSLVEIQPVYPSPSGEKQPEDLTRFFLDSLLEFMVTQVSRIEWKEKFYKQHRCFTFLFERFKEYYLPHIFPNFSKNTDLFKPYLEIPSVRIKPLPDVLMNCKVAVIKWVANFTHLTKSHPTPQIGILSSSLPNEPEADRSPGSELRRVSVGQAGCETPIIAPFSPPYDFHLLNENPFASNSQIVRDVLFMSRDNVNFIHEIFRQSFLLNFSHSSAIRRVISIYRDWFQLNVTDLPPFMLEPIDPNRSSGPSSSEFSGVEVSDETARLSRIRNDSYIGAMNKENVFARAGMQNVLQVFVTNAANVFLLDLGSDMPVMLDEQVDICKRVFNIYRYMVMHTYMEARTWEQLLMVLLHITSVILNPVPPKRKDETLGGRMAPAIFQTLIVTWIKANLNVVISRELWDQFLAVLSSLTLWEELIKEWAKTLETLTRVLARHVYGLDLTDLPLDRLSEQKTKKQRGGIKSDKSETSHPAENESLSKTPAITDINVRVEKEVPCPVLRRSASESNLMYRRHRLIRRQLEKSVIETGIANELDVFESSMGQKFVIPYRAPNIHRRWRSLDSFKAPHTSVYGYDSECVTRTPSPAPSSGVESNSFKDSPMQIDVLNSDGNVDVQDGKSVMSGGSLKGWLPDVAAVLWLRMLGALGDINKISEPILHAHVFHFLIELFDTLVKIRQNQGIPNDNQSSTPLIPELVPPLTILSPWCFQALHLPASYHNGKLCAYRLLCNMTVMVHDVPLHPKHLSLFYTTLHEGLLSKEQSVINILVKHCGPRFFSLRLPGFSLLILDFIQATDSIISSTEVRNTPRTEAISILGSLLSLPEQILRMPVLETDSHKLSTTNCPDIRDRVINIILKAGKTETAGVARCVALSNLGIFLYQELCRGSRHPKIKEAINTLLLALRFNHKTVAQSASDILLLLCDHSEELYKTYPEIPPRIVEVLVGTLSHLMPVGDSDKRLLTSLLFCLGEWTMNIPIQRLVLSHNGTSLLYNVFKVLDDLSEGGKGRGVQVGSFHPDLVQEFNSNITYDDLKQQDLPQPRRPAYSSSPSSPVHLISTTQSIQLAAKLITFHLINNLGHFPLTSGGANLGSVVVEQDDVMGLEADQLSSQLFTAPNIQVFVTSLQQVVSLVEVPALDVPGGGAVDGLISAPSQVRVIFRDLAGKASWDASVLYGTPDQCRKPEIILDSEFLDASAGNSFLNSLCVTTLPQDTLRHRPPNVLPTYRNSADDMDNLDDLLQYIGHTSPEVLESLDIARNVPPASLNLELEEEAMGSILGMRIMHQESINNSSPIVEGVQKTYWENNEDVTPFQYCRLLFSQFGMHGWDLRTQLYLVDKNEKLLREMRNLDTQRCRQTHKVAIIYVAQGQEDKNSILSNSGGSQAYEDFIAGLAWEVELETHMGFRGGLQRNKMTGVTAPYYATSFTEVIFHVSTRMPSNNAEALLQKTRHLGNDEVHIVWSEHTRDYRRGIIATEFCDVLIVIYPLPHNLYRIQVSRKPDVPYFGPLYNEALVGHMELPGLVRATALSASRAKRSMLPFYQQYYEERGRSLETVIKNHKKQTTFEEFAANIYSPQEHISANVCQSSTGSSSLQNTEECSTSSAGSTNSSTLAALLDSSTYKMTHHSHLVGDDIRASYAGGDSELSSNSGVSPRPLKKLVMKSGSKRTQPLLTPPDSPTSRRSK